MTFNTELVVDGEVVVACNFKTLPRVGDEISIVMGKGKGISLYKVIGIRFMFVNTNESLAISQLNQNGIYVIAERKGNRFTHMRSCLGL